MRRSAPGLRRLSRGADRRRRCSARASTSRPSGGQVRIRRPRAPRFVPLREGENIPVGSTVDATRGHVRLTGAATARGKLQTAVFFAGQFKVTQARNGLTELVLNGPLACPKGASAAKKNPKRRDLWGDGKGTFRTRGRYGSAAIRGTRWLTERPLRRHPLRRALRRRAGDGTSRATGSSRCARGQALPRPGATMTASELVAGAPCPSRRRRLRPGLPARCRPALRRAVDRGLGRGIACGVWIQARRCAFAVRGSAAGARSVRRRRDRRRHARHTARAPAAAPLRTPR